MPDTPIKMVEMEINETWRAQDGLVIMRVPKGWIYLIWDPDGQRTNPVFVPEFIEVVIDEIVSIEDVNP